MRGRGLSELSACNMKITTASQQTPECDSLIFEGATFNLVTWLLFGVEFDRVNIYFKHFSDLMSYLSPLRLKLTLFHTALLKTMSSVM